MSRKTLSLFGKRSADSVPVCPKCQTFMRLSLLTDRDGFEEYVHECFQCHAAEARGAMPSGKVDRGGEL
jgi:hypothetical protein